MNSIVNRPVFLGRDGTRISSFIVVAIAHVVLAYLLTLTPAREAISQASAMMVMLIREQPQVETRPTKLPTPQQIDMRLQAVPPVMLTVPAFTINKAPTESASTLSANPATVAVHAYAQPAPSEVVAPRFDADYLENPAPIYPSLSKRMGETGKVVLRVHVDVKGNAIALEIRASSGSQRLDTAAVEAVRRWRFVPAKLGDKPVEAWVLVPINFSLRTA